MSRISALLARPTTLPLLVPCGAVFFLLVLALGNPPQATGLDASWTEVQAWGFLHHVQWGRDLINTYGPLGFLHPYSFYVAGIFPAFIAGQLVLTAAFVYAIGLLFHRARLLEFVLFAVAYLCCFYRLPGDVSWLLTLPIGTAWLMSHDGSKDDGTRAGRGRRLASLLLAIAFAAIALTKFTAFPIWLLCIVAAAVAAGARGRRREALWIAVVFPGAFIAAWLGCGQSLANLPAYLWAGFETASGYRHAQGVAAPPAIEAVGLAVVLVYAAACLVAAWRARRDRAALASIALTPAVAALLWLSYFTRADDFHWPGFFAAMCLLPFALWRNLAPACGRVLPAVLGAAVATSAAMGFVQMPVRDIPHLAVTRISENLAQLGHLAETRALRERQWQASVELAALPQVRARVGRARTDMVTWQQALLLLNELDYAPRPVFQSHIAATASLARLNEAYLLGPDAPEFVLFQLDYVDNRFPMGEDNLALMVLLRRYRPVLAENGFLLLQRDAAVAAPVPVAADFSHAAAERLGAVVAIPRKADATVAFIRIKPSLLGRIYMLLFPEPPLQMTIHADDGQVVRHRLVRLTAATGFVIDPLVQSTHDWLELYFAKPLARARTLQVDTDAPWQLALFERDFAVSWDTLPILHAEATAPASLRAALYPGFSLAPVAPARLRVVQEDQRESVFLHAPARVVFAPAPGRYRISAVYGVQSAALTDPSCVNSSPDGVGVSILITHPGGENLVSHAELDPFHNVQDRGPHRLRVWDVDVNAGDTVEYRVDPGHGGKNTSCDWSYLRDVVFRAGRKDRPTRSSGEILFEDDFE
jgi:hypothetical protein